MTVASFSLDPADANTRNLAWRIHATWSDCITFDDVDKNTFRFLVAGQPCDPFYVVRFLHHALAKAATRKGQSMARRHIIAPLADLADLLEPHIKPRNGVTVSAPTINVTGDFATCAERQLAARTAKATTADAGTLDGIALSTTAMPLDVADQVLHDVKILQAQAEFTEAMLSMAQAQRLADFRAGVAAATR